MMRQDRTCMRLERQDRKSSLQASCFRQTGQKNLLDSRFRQAGRQAGRYSLTSKVFSFLVISSFIISTMLFLASSIMPMTARAAGSPTVALGVYDTNQTPMNDGEWYTVDAAGTTLEKKTGIPGESDDKYIYLKDGVLTLKNFNYTSPNSSIGIKNSSYAIYITGGACTIEMKGNSTVTAGTADPTLDTYDAAIFSSDALTFEGDGTLTAKGANATISYGVMSNGNVEVKSGTLNAQTDTATHCYGVGAGGNIKVSGGTLEATPGYAVTASYGVEAGGNVEVNGGKLNAKGGDTSQSGGDSCGVFANKSVIVSGSGILSATGGATGVRKSGVRIAGTMVAVTVSGNGNLTADSVSIGRDAAVTVSDSAQLTADRLSIYADSTVSGSGILTINEALYINEGKTLTIDDGATLINNGEVRGDGTLVSFGTIGGSGTITTANTLTKDNAGNYTVKGNVTLPEDKTLTIPEGAELTIPTDATLTVPENSTIINNGTLTNNGQLTVAGSAKGTGTFEGTGTVDAIVTFIVVGGTFGGTDTTKTITLTLTDGEAKLQDSDIPTNMTASAGFEGGSWSPDTPTADTVITVTGNRIFTYTFTAKSSGGISAGDPAPVAIIDRPDRWREFITETTQQIAVAKEGEAVTIKYDGFNCLPLSVMKQMAMRRDLTIKMEYSYKGIWYNVTYPAGMPINYSEDIPYYGPLKMADMAVRDGGFCSIK